MTTMEQHLSSTTLKATLRDGAFTGSWILDPSRSEVDIRTRSRWGFTPVKGVFRDVTGGGTVTPAGEVVGPVMVAATSIDTGNPVRDTRLRSPDFLDAATFPDITAKIYSVKPTDGRTWVTGTLTVRGQTQPVMFDAEVSSVPGRVSIDGIVRVNRRDYGVTTNTWGMMSMRNRITMHLVFDRL